MIRRSFLRRMALAAAACAFIDVPWPKAEPRPTFTRAGPDWGAHFPPDFKPQPMTVYAQFIERAPQVGERVEMREVIDHVEDFPIDLATMGVPPNPFGPWSVKVVKGIRTIDEMRALAKS